MKKRTLRKKHLLKNVNAKCFFCENKTNPVYTDPDTLEKYLTERGKIVSRSRTGICNRHQKKLTREIKRARHIAYLPFVVRV